MEKKSKYDTNPLDPEVVRRTDDVWGATRATGERDAPETQDMNGAATRDIRRTPQEQAREDLNAEAPTRRYDQPKFPTSYPSVFVPPVYEPPSTQKSPGLQGGASATGLPPRFAQQQGSNAPPTSRPIPNINLPENLVMMLPYVPFPFVGAVVAAVLLFLIPRSEPRSRFHAAQGLAMHLIVLVVSILTGLAEDIVKGPAGITLTIASSAFSIGAFVFFIISMVRVYKGQPHVVAPISQLTGWLNEKVEPRKP